MYIERKCGHATGKQQRKSPATVSSIQTEYVRSHQKKEERIHARKVRLYRRLAVYAIAAVIILGALIHTNLSSKTGTCSERAKESRARLLS